MQYIPPEFLEGGSTTTGGGVSSPSIDDSGGQQQNFGQGAIDNANRALDNTIAQVTGDVGTRTKPFSQYSPEEFGTYLKQRQSGIGQFIDNLPILGPLLTMQDASAREFARKSLIQGKNFVTGEPITNKEADILMQVADMPEGRSFLQVIDDFLQGKSSAPGGTYKGTKPIVIDDRPPIDTELRRTTYEPQKRIDTQQDVSKLYGDRQFTPETIGEDPQQQYYGPPGQFQNMIELSLIHI